jgi:transcriptional regulator with XRE-family HTH domain
MKIRDKLASGGNRKPDKVATTSERLQIILSEKQMKQSDLARATGISRGAISNYVLGRYAPKSDIVQKLANALNCSEMWLWGYDVPMHRTDIEKKNDQLVELVTLLRTDNEFLDLAQKLSKLTPEQRQSLKPILSAFTQQQLMD